MPGTGLAAIPRTPTPRQSRGKPVEIVEQQMANKAAVGQPGQQQQQAQSEQESQTVCPLRRAAIG